MFQYIVYQKARDEGDLVANMTLKSLWIYFTATLCGGILAGLFAHLNANVNQRLENVKSRLDIKIVAEKMEKKKGEDANH